MVVRGPAEHPACNAPHRPVWRKEAEGVVHEQPGAGSHPPAGDRPSRRAAQPGRRPPRAEPDRTDPEPAPLGRLAVDLPPPAERHCLKALLPPPPGTATSWGTS